MSTTRDERPPPAARLLPEISLAVWMFLIAGLTVLGSDLMWVVAMGDILRATGEIPQYIPFASAPQSDWHNPLAVAQVLLSAIHSIGPAALAAFQLLLVAATLVVILAEARRLGGGARRITVVIALVVLGCAAPFVVARLPTLSLLPFAVGMAIMRRHDVSRGRAIWWLVPLFALWGNLHGGVLVGLAVFLVFLLASPQAGHPGQRVVLGLVASASLLATSAGLNTPAYYLGVLNNEAAARRTDLWAAPDLANPLDVAMLGSALILVAMCVRRGLPLWEWLTAAGLAVGTVMAARHGVWLIMFLAPAAAGLRRRCPPPSSPVQGRLPRAGWTGIAVLVLATVVGGGWQLFRRADAVDAPGASVVPLVQSLAAGRTVLAVEPLAETLAQAELTVWAVNPIDAFTHPVQVDFLDFLHDGRVPASSGFDVIVVRDDEVLDQSAGGSWRVVAEADGYAILLRR